MKLIRILFILICVSLLIPHSVEAQRKVERSKDEIMTEGMALYMIILANWTSNDLYYENEFNTNAVKGYLSYKQKDTIKTIFWREIDTASAEYKTKMFKAVGDTGEFARKDKPMELRRVIKTINYKRMQVTRENAHIVDEAERVPTKYETMLMDYRGKALKAINTDTTFFKQYEYTKLKSVPLDLGKEVKVYVYSPVLKNDVVPFGGDYEILFDRKTKEISEKKDLHQDCVFISTHYAGKASDAVKATEHHHSDAVSPFITATDVATLLLYKNILEWDEHRVVSGKYTSVFTTVDRKLDILPTAEYEALQKKKRTSEKEEKNQNFH